MTTKLSSANNPPAPDESTLAAQEDALDVGLEESFPASDPVAIDVEHPSKAAKKQP